MREEASRWVSEEIERLRGLDYHALLEMRDKPLHTEITSSSGEVFIRETGVFWDDREKGNLRVFVDVWNPRRRIALSIAKDDFIRAPDGTFVDE